MTSGEPLQARRSEKSRLAIFEATLQLISEIGYERLTIEGIAARAKVGKQTVYRWWPSKAALVVDVMLGSDDFFVWPVRNADKTAEQDLDAWAIDMVKAYTTEPRVSMMRAMTSATAADPSVTARVEERYGRPALRRLRDLFQEVAPAAEPDDVALAAEMFIGAFSFRGNGAAIEGAVTAEFGRSVLKILLRSLLEPATPTA
jgi:AcrR family transcriptional regulator